MIVEIGHFAVVAALVAALALGVVGHVSAVHGAWRSLAATLASCQLALLAVGFAVLVRAFVVSDFSVAYVAENSNSLLPWYYRDQRDLGCPRGLVSSVDVDHGGVDLGGKRWKQAPA